MMNRGQLELGWTVVLRRMPVRLVEGRPEGGYTNAFEIICCDCGDDPDLDYRAVPPELQRIRGPYQSIAAGAAGYENHVRLHDAPQPVTGLFQPIHSRQGTAKAAGELRPTTRWAKGQVHHGGVMPPAGPGDGLLASSEADGPIVCGSRGGTMTAETPVLDTLADLTAASIVRNCLPPRELMLVRLAALIAVDAPPASYLANAGAAEESGITTDDIQGVMIGVAPVVGTARVVSAGGQILRALGMAIAVADAEPPNGDGAAK